MMLWCSHGDRTIRGKIDLVDVQFIAENVFKLPAAASLGDIVEFIRVLIDAHKGSLSNKSIRALISVISTCWLAHGCPPR